MEQGLEDRKLGLEGGEVLGAEGGAVGGIRRLKGGAILKGGEADATAGGHRGREVGVDEVIGRISF